METGDTQTGNNQTVTVSQPLTVSDVHKARLDIYIDRINKLSPE